MKVEVCPMKTQAAYATVLAATLVALAAALAAAVAGEFSGCLAALAVMGLTWALLPASTSQVWKAIARAYVSFASWAANACFVLTVAAVCCLALAGWIQGDDGYFRLGLWAFAYGLAAMVVISLPLSLQGADRPFKAPEGLPPIEEAQREADELLDAE